MKGAERRWRGVSAIVALAAASVCNGLIERARAEAFSAPKTFSMLIGAAPGGGYDAYGRLVANFIGKHIPGKPDVITKNMPGAGSIVAARYLATLAPKDGSVIAALHPAAITEPLLGAERNIGYDPKALFYLGSANSDAYVCAVRINSPIRSFSDLAKRQALFGASARTSSTYQSAAFLAHVLGAKIKIVSGYSGTREIFLALERKEIDGLCGLGWSSLRDEIPEWRTKLRVILQEGLQGFEALDQLGAPVALKFAKTDSQRDEMSLFYGQETFGRPFAMAQQIPPESKPALRRAFVETMRDPDLLAEAGRRRLDIAPIDGEELQKAVEQIYSTPRSVVEETRAAIGAR